MKNPIYLVYGLMVLSFVGFAEFRGWTLGGVSEQKNVPRSVRDNPGAYRSTYGGYSRYIGGK